jgi:hypothetical protein
MTTAQFVISATDATQAAFRSVSRNLDLLATQVTSVSSKLGLVGVGAVIGAATLAGIRQGVNELAALDDAAQSTGASVEELSALFNTLRANGTTISDISDIAGKLTRAMDGAEEETAKAAIAFRSLGINVKNANGDLRSPVEVLNELALELDKYADGANKTALVQKIFGKSGAALIPVLKDLAQFEKQSATASTEAAAAAADFEDNARRLTGSLTAFASQIAGPVLKQFNNLIEQFKVGRDSAGGFFAALGRYGLDSGGDPTKKLQDNLKKIEDIDSRLKSLQQVKESNNSGRGFFGRGAATKIDQDVAALTGQREQLLKDRRYFELLQKQEGVNTNLRSPSLYGDGLKKPPAPRLADDSGNKKKQQQTDAQKLLADATEQLELLDAQARAVGDLTEGQKKLLQIDAQVAAGKIKLTEADRLRLQLTYESIDAIAREQAAKQSFEQASAAASALSSRLFKEQSAATEALRNATVERGLAIEEIGKESAALLVLRDARLRAKQAQENDAALAAANAGDSDTEFFRRQNAGLVGDERSQLAAETLKRLEVENAERLRNVQSINLSSGALIQLKDARADEQIAMLQTNIELLKQDENAKALVSTYEKLVEQLKKSKTISAVEVQTQKATETAQALQGAFTSAFEQAAVSGKKLSEVLKGLGKDLLSLFLRKAVTEPLAQGASDIFKVILNPGSPGGGGGSGSSIVSRFLDFFNFGGARASGGPVDAFRPYLVGEKGPELMVPGRAGTVIPAGQFGSGMVLHLTIHQSVGEFVTPSQLAQVAAATKEAAQLGVMEGNRRAVGVY